MEKSKDKQRLNNCIDWYKDKIEYNAICKDMNKVTRDFIEQFGNLKIPPRVLIEQNLINYMKSVGRRFNRLKREADLVVKKWQQQIDLWLKENNLTEKWYLEQVSDDKKNPEPLSPRLNGAWKTNLGSSDTDYKQNYQSSSSQDIDSPDSQRADQRKTDVNHRLYKQHPFVRISSSPPPLENRTSRKINSAEFNANLRIDPKEVAPSNKVQESPAKSNERFCVALKEKMFTTIKSKEPVLEKNMSMLLYLCKDVLGLPLSSYPEYLRDYQESLKNLGQRHRDNPVSSDCAKSVDGKNKKKIGSNDSPSTPQQGVMESSRSCSESRHDRKRKHMESIQSVPKTKELKEEKQPAQESKDLPSMSQQGMMESSRNCNVSRQDRKRKQMESTQSVVKIKEPKEEQHSSQDSKDLPSTPLQDVVESSRNYHASRHDTKREYTQSIAKSKELKEGQLPIHGNRLKHKETTQLVKSKELKKEQQPVQNSKLLYTQRSQSAPKSRELREEQHSAQDSKLKHMTRTQSGLLVKGKELREEQCLAQSRMLNCREIVQSNAKAKEMKEEQQPIQDTKRKLDPKHVSAMVSEVRNSDKNTTRKRESPDQSAMIAITSSKKERTSVYHGGRKCEVPKLQDMCIKALVKGLKQSMDVTKFINKKASFETLEPILVTLTPDKLYRIEEDMKYLLKYTDSVWKLHCTKKFRSQVQLKKDNESWRTFYHRCCTESEEKFKNVTASVTASASKTKPDRQIKFISMEGPPTKRQRLDSTAFARNNANHSTAKPLPNSTHLFTSRSDVPVPPKASSNYNKSGNRIVKKDSCMEKADAPLMHKAKKTLGQLHRIHRN
ncbi:Transcription elongation factor B polypeptide like protein [Argiope bruennichi]|uniref:Transcription elongation factor B polypeptide like protein n=1 Tax=Argiope bruennichi TaxID=94029 RepID=A0A8T0EPQ1_ARGBR|nr:Transcription elongation factor B polypeptide like protein [Argiope bruennichi]